MSPTGSETVCWDEMITKAECAERDTDPCLPNTPTFRLREIEVESDEDIYDEGIQYLVAEQGSQGVQKVLPQ